METQVSRIRADNEWYPAYREGVVYVSKIRVLIVDDSSVARLALQSILERDRDIQVVGLAADGAEGLQKVRELRPDVVTLDVQMPVMDGLTALKFIMSQTPTPVLMVSSTTHQDSRERAEALALGAVSCIAKPTINGEDLAKISGEIIYRVKLAHACAQ